MVSQAPLPQVTVLVRHAAPDLADRVFAESEGTIGGDPVQVMLTHRGLYLRILRKGQNECFGISLTELARVAAAEIETMIEKRSRA